MTITKRNLNFLTFAAVAFLIFGSSVRAQTSASFKVTGPCVNCGAEYLEGIVLKINGVKKAAYNKENFMLSLQYDAAVASELDIQLELATKGYDAGDFSHDASATLPACARSGMTRGDADALGLSELDDEEAPVDWESPENLAELEALGRRGDDDSEISDELIIGDEDSDESQELLNWESVSDLDDPELEEEEEDGNP